MHELEPGLSVKQVLSVAPESLPGHSKGEQNCPGPEMLCPGCAASPSLKGDRQQHSFAISLDFQANSPSLCSQTLLPETFSGSGFTRE